MRILIGILIIVAILTSGCVSTVNPVDPADVISSPAPFTIKEFQEQDISVAISNNGTGPIDSVKVTSFDPFTVVSSGILNIPARTNEVPSSASISLKVQAPSFKTDVNNSVNDRSGSHPWAQTEPRPRDWLLDNPEKPPKARTGFFGDH